MPVKEIIVVLGIIWFGVCFVKISSYQNDIRSEEWARISERLEKYHESYHPTGEISFERLKD